MTEHPPMPNWTIEDLAWRDSIARHIFQEAVLRMWRHELTAGVDPFYGGLPLEELAQSSFAAATAMMMVRKAWPLPNAETWRVVYREVNL